MQAPKPESFYSAANVAARKQAQEAAPILTDLTANSLALLRMKIYQEKAAALSELRKEPTPDEALARFRQGARQEARNALAASLAKQGKVVRSELLPNVPYLGTVHVSPDRNFLVQELGRGHVAIHDLNQLEGSYTSGQKSEIVYRNGAGKDRLQEQPEQNRDNSRGFEPRF